MLVIVANLAASVSLRMTLAELNRLGHLFHSGRSFSALVIVMKTTLAGITTAVVVAAEHDMAAELDQSLLIYSNTSIRRERPCSGFCKACRGSMTCGDALRSVFVMADTFLRWEMGRIERVIPNALLALAT